MTGEAQSNTLIFLLGKKIPQSSMLTSALYSNMKLLSLLLIAAIFLAFGAFGALDAKKQTC